MDWQGWFALGLAGTALILMSAGRFAPHLVMMGVLVVLSASGIVSADQALAFRGLTLAALPRGATLTSAVLHVAPHSGSNGALSVNVRAAVECDGGPHATAPLGLESSAHLQQLDGPTVPWDVPPYLSVSQTWTPAPARWCSSSRSPSSPTRSNSAW